MSKQRTDKTKELDLRHKIRASGVVEENLIRPLKRIMSSPRPWSDSEGEVNTASRIEVRELNESANDLDQEDQQNQNNTNARHAETTGEGSAAVRGWAPRWGQRQIPPWASRTTGQRVAYCVGRRRNTRGVNTFRNAHIAYKRKIERALERCRARERSLLEELSLLERREVRVQELGLSSSDED